MFTSHRTAAVAAVIAALAGGCSGPSTTGPSALPTETEITTEVVLSRTLDDVEPGSQRTINLTMPRQGALVVTLRWNDPANSVVAVLTGTGCWSQRSPDGACSIRHSVEREGRTGREQFIEAPDAAGAYLLLVKNEGPGLESIRVSAELTSSVPVLPPPAPSPTGPPPPPTPTPRRSGDPG